MTPSVFTPAGDEALLLREVAVVLVAGATLVFAVVLGLLGVALRRRGAAPVAWWVVGGGVVLPAVVLSALLLYVTLRTAALERAAPDPLVIGVTGRLWWWEVRYHDRASGRDIVLANELRLPLGRTAQLGLTAEEVIHSLWVPALGGKRDLVPGRVNALRVTPRRLGVFRGQCAEYCGLQHAHMALHVVVVTEAEFARWLTAQAQPAAAVTPADAVDAPTRGAEADLVRRGRAAFLAQGCAACHTVRGLNDGSDAGINAGIDAGMARGPDLTHVASRHGLGAGTLANGPGAMQRWLVGVQQLKPGARMPSYAHLDAATLAALAAYLESLQ